MDREYLTRYIKHSIKKIIGKPDPVWPFYSFEHRILPQTKNNLLPIRAWAEEHVHQRETYEREERYMTSEDPIVIQGFTLKKKIEKEFNNKYSHVQDIRILIQTPDPLFSPGGFSAFSNLVEAFSFIGIPTEILGWNDETKKVVESFKPTVFLTTDHADFLNRINWKEISNYRKNNKLYIGLIAHLEEYGNTPLLPRLEWAKKHDINFYFSFRDRNYFMTRKEYKPFFDQGYSIIPLMFGANILHYYPIPNIEKDLDYSFIASTNWTKGKTYLDYAGKIVSHYPGFIDGVGWKHSDNFVFNKDRDRYIYAQSKTGLNFHLPEQIEWACEVNERTHQLAACGIPQIIDNPKLLPKLYSHDSFFVASDGKEFFNHFKTVLHNPEIGTKFALKAQREAFEQHTTFHRAAGFIEELKELIKKL